MCHDDLAPRSRRDRTRRQDACAILASCAALLFAACDGDEGTQDNTQAGDQGASIVTMDMETSEDVGAQADDGVKGDDQGAMPDLPGGEVQAASRANLKFKGGRRYALDLAAALDLERDEVCEELGARDCVSDVFLVSLGGVEPLLLRIYEPVEGLATSTIATERVALHACINAAEKDAREERYALFTELRSPDALENQGVRENVVERFTTRLLGRAATALERAEWSALFVEFDADMPAEERAREWMVLTCFGVATMNENLFY